MSVWSQRYDALAGAGLGQLVEISTLLALAAILAMTAAVTSVDMAAAHLTRGTAAVGRPAAPAASDPGGGSVRGAQRRMRYSGVSGVCAQVIVDGYLKHVTGFPISVLAAGWQPIETLAIVMAWCFALAAAPGWSASRVSPTLALADE